MPSECHLYIDLSRRVLVTRLFVLHGSIEMGTSCPQYELLQAEFDNLVDRLVSDIEPVARKAFSAKLISLENLSKAECGSQDRFSRASYFLRLILLRVKENRIHFHTFVDILNDMSVYHDLVGELNHKLSRLQVQGQGSAGVASDDNESPSSDSGDSDTSNSGCNNGFLRVKRMTNFEFRGKPQRVATIFFGTSYCSVAYKLFTEIDHGKPCLLKLDESCLGNMTMPICILFNNQGKRLYFGYQALDCYRRYERPIATERFIYFEHVKIHNKKIKAQNGKEYFLVDVIAHIFCHLKEQLLCTVRAFGLDFDATDFDWVITVPAGWRANGKRVIREAGYKAGLCTVRVPPDLKEAGDLEIRQHLTEKSPDKLSLALESESAALYCQQEAERAKEGAAIKYVPKSEHYLIVNIEEETIDITTYSMVAGGIVELVQPTQCYFGVTRINQNFKTFLGKFINDPDFSRYIDIEDEQNRVRHRAELTNLIYTEFEFQKKIFGSQQCTTQSFKIVFPFTFWRTYQTEILEGGHRRESGIQIEDDGNVMRIMPEKMAEFFQPVVSGIADFIMSHLRSNNLTDIIDTIYFVGSGCNCIDVHNVHQVGLQLKSIIGNLSVSTPFNADLASIYGATFFRCNPGVARQRRADASYGVSCSSKFDSSIHSQEYKYWNADLQGYYCKKLFKPLVTKGDLIGTNEVFVIKLFPLKKDQKSMSISLYSTPRKAVRYVTEDEVYKLETITVDMEGSGLNREVEFVLDITHAELHLLARDNSSPNSSSECKVVVDLLSKNE